MAAVEFPRAELQPNDKALSPLEGFAQLPNVLSCDSLPWFSERATMRVRVCGQLSLADDLVRAPENGVLDEIAGAADWAALEVVLRSLRNRRSEAGAPGNPPVLLRCLLLGLWHGGLSDPALEAALADRLSFRRFVGLSLDGPTPDHSTLWRFRAAL